MENAKIKFKYLAYDGKIKSKVIPIKMPNFKNRYGEFIDTIFPITRDSQIMDFLDNMDKSELMISNEFNTILDYHVHIPQKRKENIIHSNFTVIEDSYNELDRHGMLADFIAVSKVMKSSIADMSIQNKVKIILSAMEVSSTSHVAGMDRVLSILNSPSNKLDIMKDSNE